LNELPIDNPLGLAGPAGMVATVAFGVGLALHWGSLPAAAVCVLLRFRPTFRSEQGGTGATFWLRAGCSASDQKAPHASGLLTLLARRSRRLPTHPKGSSG
jgi:hypothetical protein